MQVRVPGQAAAGISLRSSHQKSTLPMRAATRPFLPPKVGVDNDASAARSGNCIGVVFSVGLSIRYYSRGSIYHNKLRQELEAYI